MDWGRWRITQRSQPPSVAPHLRLRPSSHSRPHVFSHWNSQQQPLQDSPSGPARQSRPQYPMHDPQLHQAAGSQSHQGQGSRPRSGPSAPDARPVRAWRGWTAGVRAHSGASGLVSRVRQSTMSKHQSRSTSVAKKGTHKTHLPKPLVNASNMRPSSGAISTSVPPKVAPIPTPWASWANRSPFRHDMWEPAFVAVSAAPLGKERTRRFPSHTPSVVEPSRPSPPTGRVEPRSSAASKAQPDSLDRFFVRVRVRMPMSMSVSMSVRRRMGTHHNRTHRAEALPPYVPSSTEHASGRASRATHNEAHGRHRRAHCSHLGLWAADPANGHGGAHRVGQWRWRTDYHARREGETNAWLARRHWYARNGHPMAWDWWDGTRVPNWPCYHLSRRKGMR